LRDRGRGRPDLGEGCPERVDPAFLAYVWRYPRRSRPRTLAGMAAFADRGGVVVTPRTAGDVADLTAALGDPDDLSRRGR